MEHVYYSADFLGVVRTILLVLILIYGIRFLMRILATWILRKAQSKIQSMAEEKMRQGGFNPNYTAQRPEGSVTVEKMGKKKTKQSSAPDNDEYVDYEVIE